MSGFGRGLASLGAIAGGLVQGERMLRDDARIKEQDDMRKQEFDAKMGDVNRANQTRISLADAYRPRTAADGVVTDGQKGNENVTINPVDTVALNTPEAQDARAAKVYREIGDPGAALSLGNAIKQGKLSDIQLDTAQTDKAKRIREEGLFETANATRSGDAQKVFDVFNSKGKAKLDAVPTVTPRDIEIPGFGKIKSFDYAGSYTDEKGQKVPFKVNSHDLSMSLFSYKDQLGLGKDAVSAGLKDDDIKAGVNLKNAQADYYKKGGSAGAAAATGGKPPIGYRPTSSGNLEPIPGGPADTKIQGALNADTAALTGSISSFDRLAASANEVLKHPGLDGITGWRGKIPNAPGTDAANAQALLATLKSQVGFGVLQDMRNNSKSGGALGSVSDAEGKRLEDNLAALDKSQSPEQFKANLQKIVDYAEQAKDRMRESYNIRHPGAAQRGTVSGNRVSPEGSWGTGKAANVPANLPRVATPADAMKLPSGTVFVDANGVTRTRP